MLKLIRLVKPEILYLIALDEP